MTPVAYRSFFIASVLCMSLFAAGATPPDDKADEGLSGHAAPLPEATAQPNPGLSASLSSPLEAPLPAIDAEAFACIPDLWERLEAIHCAYDPQSDQAILDAYRKDLELIKYRKSGGRDYRQWLWQYEVKTMADCCSSTHKNPLSTDQHVAFASFLLRLIDSLDHYQRDIYKIDPTIVRVANMAIKDLYLQHIAPLVELTQDTFVTPFFQKLRRDGIIKHDYGLISLGTIIEDDSIKLDGKCEDQLLSYPVLYTCKKGKFWMMSAGDPQHPQLYCPPFDFMDTAYQAAF